MTKFLLIGILTAISASSLNNFWLLLLLMMLINVMIATASDQSLLYLECEHVQDTWQILLLNVVLRVFSHFHHVRHQLHVLRLEDLAWKVMILELESVSEASPALTIEVKIKCTVLFYKYVSLLMFDLHLSTFCSDMLWSLY